MYNNSNRTNGAKDIITAIDLIKASYVKGVHFHAHNARTRNLGNSIAILRFVINSSNDR